MHLIINKYIQCLNRQVPTLKLLLSNKLIVIFILKRFLIIDMTAAYLLVTYIILCCIAWADTFILQINMLIKRRQTSN